ncbi:unnamed protein product [Closterium sp. Yama58-4]|nr:unnamed protein product [Closterium sp. Yama58-4]
MKPSVVKRHRPTQRQRREKQQFELRVPSDRRVRPQMCQMLPLGVGFRGAASSLHFTWETEALRPTREEEIKYARAVQDLLRLRRYASRRVTVEELIVAGYGGLIKGIERFDPDRGFRLSTYCYWWIRHSIIQSAVDQSSIIKLPAYLHSQHMLTRRQRAHPSTTAPSSTSPTLSTSAPLVESNQKRGLTPGSVRLPRSLEGDAGTGESLGVSI